MNSMNTKSKHVFSRNYDELHEKYQTKCRWHDYHIRCMPKGNLDTSEEWCDVRNDKNQIYKALSKVRTKRRLVLIRRSSAPLDPAMQILVNYLKKTEP